MFGVKESLICKFDQHDAKDEDAKRFGIEPPFCTAHFNFVLNRHK